MFASAQHRAVLGVLAGIVAVAAGAPDSSAQPECRRWESGPLIGGTNAAVYASGQFGSRYVAAGNFQVPTAAGGVANNIAGWDGADVTAFGAGFNGPVSALKTYSSLGVITGMIAGGSFTTGGTVGANRIAIWVENSATGLPPAWAALGQGLNGPVTAIERLNNQVIAGGSFTASGATTMYGVARFNSQSGQWEPMGAGFPNGAITALKVFNNELYAGGIFFPGGAVFHKWNGSAWVSAQAIGGPGGPNAEVLALEVYNNTLILGGYFQSGATLTNILRYDGAGMSLLGSGGASSTVTCLHAANGILYAGGDFASIAGVSAARVAQWNGTNWADLVGGVDSIPYTLRVFHDELIAGGIFSTAGGVSRPRIARFLTTGAPWIARQPYSRTTCTYGANLYCGVPAGYGPLLAYRWRRGGVPLADGATATGSTIVGSGAGTLFIQYANNSDEGAYDCVVSSPCGGETSVAATLTLCMADDDCNGLVQPADVSSFVSLWFFCIQHAALSADYDHNGSVDPADVSRFVTTWFDEVVNGC